MKKIFSIIILLMSLYLISCKDIFEDDLSNLNVTLIAPADSVTIANPDITFLWDEVSGANQYQIQIVKPDFVQIQEVVVDSTISECKFTYTLIPGAYEWRVKALNTSSETQYAFGAFLVDTSVIITGQNVNLLSPGDNNALNNISIDFLWSELSNANDYRFEIRRNSWNGVTVYGPEITTDNNITVNLNEGTYVWGVQAQNDYSSTTFSVWTLTIDTTKPLPPVVIYPLNNNTVYDSTLVSSTITFSWNRVTDIGSSRSDSIIISTDSLLRYGRLVETVAVNSSYSFQLQNAGTYYWRLRPLDAAGNAGTPTNILKFYYEK